MISMKYTVSRVCGHTETVNLYGSRQSREASIQWLEQTMCKKCFRETQAAELDEYTPARMSYREFKLNYTDYKAEPGSYDPADKTIIVYIPQDIDPDQEMDKRRGKLILDLMALNISEGEAIQYTEIGAYQLHDIVEEEENKRKTKKEDVSGIPLGSLRQVYRRVREYEQMEELIGLGYSEKRAREWIQIGCIHIKSLLESAESQVAQNLKLGKIQITQQLKNNMIMGYIVLEILSRGQKVYRENENYYGFAQQGLKKWTNDKTQ